MTFKPILVRDDTDNFGYKDGKKDELKTFPSSDCFQRSDIDWLEYTAYQFLDFHKIIQDSHFAKEYAQDYSHLMGKLNKKL